MAINATFTANFSSFYGAVEKAEATLRDFGDGADKVGRRLDILSNQFSGRSIVQEATIMAKAVEEIGGVSKLTEKELARLGATTNEAVAKMKALGLEVPKNLQAIADQTKDANKASSEWLGTLGKMASAVGIAFSVGAITSFIGSVFEAAGAIKDQSTALGMSAESFQRIKFAVEQGGGSLEDFTKAANKLNDNLATGSNSTVAALKAAGLAFQDIRGMKPEDAFLAVSEAVGKIEDPMERARVAQDLFGKGALALIPGMVEGYGKVAAGAKVMSDDTINRLEAAGDAWERLKNRAVIFTGELLAQVEKDFGAASRKTFWESTKALVTGGISGYQDYMASVEAAQKKTAEAAASDKKAQEEKEALARQTAALTARTEAQEAADKKAAEAADAYQKKIQALTDSISGAGLAVQVKDLAAAYAKLTPAQQSNLEVMLRLADKARALRDSGATLTAGLANLVDQQDELNRVLDNEAEAVIGAYQAEQARLVILGKTTVGLLPLAAAEKEHAAAMAAAMIQTGAQIQATTEYNAVLTDLAYRLSVAKAEQDNMAAAGSSSAKALGSSVSSSILSAIQGGGSVLQSAGSAIGNFLVDPKQSGLGKAIEAGVSKLPGFLGGAISAAIPVVGSLIGPAVGWLGSKIAGLFGKKEHEKLRDSFLQAAGGLGPLTEAANKAGVSLEKLFGAKKTDQVKAAIEDIQAALAAEDLRSAFVAAEGGFESLVKAATTAGISVDALFAARTSEEVTAAIGEVEAALKFQADAYDVAIETAKRYGFTLEELGPAMARQELDKQAQQLFKDWEVLNSAGIDTIEITEHMSESISKYLNDAMKMGTEVPAAMRPMLEQMAKSGKLLDENGDAITDLDEAGVKFSLSMSDGFKKLIDEVSKLTDAIARSLGLAIKNIPQPEIKGKVTWDVDKPPASSGGKPTESYQHGTDGFRNFGTGTPVMLHGWEAVVPYSESRDTGAFATVGGVGLGAAPAAGGPSIVINAQGAFFDTPGDLQRLADRVNEALTAKYGLRNTLRAG